MNITDEAKPHWDQLSEAEKTKWTANESCQSCHRKIPPEEFNVSISEEQLALFHMCPQCGTKEVRLIVIDERSQKEIDLDFEQWIQAKKKANPEKYGD